MNLRTIIIGLSAISALGLVAVACSSSSTDINTTAKDGGGGGTDGGGGNTEGGGGDTDGGGGGNCKLADGVYTLTTKATVGPDVDASSPFEGSCKDGTSMVTIDSTKDGGGGASGCTTMTSADGCDITIDCTSDTAGYKTTIKIEDKISADGSGFTLTTTTKTVLDDGGAAQAECTTVGTAVKM